MYYCNRLKSMLVHARIIKPNIQHPIYHLVNNESCIKPDVLALLLYPVYHIIKVTLCIQMSQCTKCLFLHWRSYIFGKNLLKINT